jgi:hypothetical protein
MLFADKIRIRSNSISASNGCCRWAKKDVTSVARLIFFVAINGIFYYSQNFKIKNL